MDNAAPLTPRWASAYTMARTACLHRWPAARGVALAAAVAVLAAGLGCAAASSWAQSETSIFDAIMEMAREEESWRESWLHEEQEEEEEEKEKEKEKEKEEEDSPTPAKGVASEPTAEQRPYSVTGPVALVESIENAPKAGVDFLDYVYANQAIDLNPGGVLVLSYFDSCVRETITGGRVRVGAGRSSVSGSTINTETVGCQGTKPLVTAEASEAGGVIKRVTPFKEEEWREFTVKTDRPVFKWQPESRGQPATVTVVYLDAKPLKIIWQGMTRNAYLPYPQDALPLETGMPYLVQVANPSGRRISAVFSVDPWLDVADNAANRVVPIGR